jgi:hypothetical protein
MNDRRIFALMAVLAASALLATTAPAGAQVIESLWQSAPMTIDGVAQEWETSQPIIDDGSQVQYALRNDGRNLYIIMVFRAPQPGSRSRVFPKSTLDYTGMKIYFTTGSKKSKDYGILFQKKEYTADALIASMEKRGQTVSEAQKAEIRKKNSQIVYTEEVIKPKKAVAPSGGAGDSDAPMFRVVEKGPLAVHEFRIPLNRVPALGGVDAKPGQEILIGFEWGGMTNQILRDMMAGRADRSVSARDSGSQMGGSGTITADSMAGGEGGDIRGMGGGVGEMGRDPRYQKHAFWISAKLASEK